MQLFQNLAHVRHSVAACGKLCVPMVRGYTCMERMAPNLSYWPPSSCWVSHCSRALASCCRVAAASSLKFCSSLLSESCRITVQLQVSELAHILAVVMRLYWQPTPELDTARRRHALLLKRHLHVYQFHSSLNIFQLGLHLCGKV